MAESYAVIVEGVVLEILKPVQVGGAVVGVSDQFHPEFLAGCVPIDGVSPEPAPGWHYDSATGFAQ